MNIRLSVYAVVHFLRTLYAGFLDPQTCILCRSFCSNGLPVCDHCIETELLPYILSYADEHSASFQRCSYCGKILISEKDTCTACRSADTGADRQRYFRCIFTLFPYIGLGQCMLPAWKHDSVRTFAAVFAPLVYRFLQEMPRLHGIPIVPIPPRPLKMRQKGWDQIEDMCKQLECFAGITVYRCLSREDGKAQKQLSKKERAQNLKGKIHLKTSVPLPEKLIIFDDVRTTGATLQEAAKVLSENGCTDIYALCLFFD